MKHVTMIHNVTGVRMEVPEDLVEKYKAAGHAPAAAAPKKKTTKKKES